MALQKTDATVGIREDLTDILSMISPTNRPFTSNIGRMDASATLHEWQNDILDSASWDRAAEEGADAGTGTALVPTQRFANNLQIFERTAFVSRTLGAVDTAGRGDEMDYQVMKRLEEVGNDYEKRCLSPFAADLDSSGGAFPGGARALAGAGTWLWINDNTTGVTGGDTDDPRPGKTPDTNVTDVTIANPITAVTEPPAAGDGEERLKDVIGSCWDNGGNPTMVLANRHDKIAISGFKGIATQYKDNINGPAVIIGAADVYVSDFGTHYVVASHFLPKAGATEGKWAYVGVFDTDLWKTVYLRPMQRQPLAENGDAEKTQVICEATLQCTNIYASGKITGSSPLT